MGWSHEEYLDTPLSMIHSIFAMMREEAEETKRRNKG
jgi:hypothetical protein